MAAERDTRVCLGAIAGAYGVRGEARVKSFCAEPEAIAAYGPLESEDGTRRFTLRLTGPIKEGFAARLSGVTTREEAEALKGTRLYAPRDRLPALPEDEFYHADLIGLSAVDTGGDEIGRVRAVHDYGAGDMLDVVPAVGGKGAEMLIPFTRAAVPSVDLSQGRIVVDLGEAGLAGAGPEGEERDD